MRIFKGMAYNDNRMLVSEVKFLPSEENGDGWWALFTKENRPGAPVKWTEWFETQEEAYDGLFACIKDTPLISLGGNPIPRKEFETMTKRVDLKLLAQDRMKDRLNGFKNIGDFHDGYYECQKYVSPWTKSGANFDADIMIIGQDWCGENLLKEPKNSSLRNKGYDASYPTNKNLDDLLDKAFGIGRTDCYLTNVFPFVKSGNAGTTIGMGALKYCAENYTRKEIEIVVPKIIICLGLRTFIALRRAYSIPGTPRLNEAINNSIETEQTSIYCVAHTGSRGMNNRSRFQVERDWANIAAKCRRSQ